jgi:hydrogenase/urease accessory protein HupE
MRPIASWAWCLLLVALTLLAGPVPAHDMSIAEMEVREVGGGEFLWQWTATDREATHDLKPAWPAQCGVEATRLRCGAQGLQGELSIDGVGRRYSAVIVKVFWADGTRRVHTLTAAQPVALLYGAADERRGAWEVAKAYAVLGVEHILTGFDHLLFVLGLLFLVGFRRRLVATITAFTLAHSLTLALSALGWVALRPPPVEASIALSIVLVAGEAVQQRDSLARRWPALVAFLFGLVHGLGFAGALREIGLPAQHLPVALFTFNVGVEVGQLVVLGVAWLVWRAARQRPGFIRLRTPALYGIGTVAAWWSCLRVAALFA